ncbi:porin [Burkholderia sp. L27(2015)]|uniref:porin n=1 Tax=Burkholderia sp. L27(2015) TaxID=1641858 RepID=UPI00131E5441|nr:porin [Burkholderia sp. L27(2015)]
MKKVLLVSAIASLFCATAHAQSSVTLYGIIDEGVQFNSNAKNIVGTTNVGGRQVALDSASGLNGSRWGLRGAEDLGDGLKAIFTLESGVNLNTGAFGQGTTPFGRQAFVGLSSTKYGTVTLGRQYDSVVTYVQPVTTIAYVAGTSLFAHPGDLDNTDNSLRTNNTIKYASPSFSGLTFGAEVSLGGQAGNVTGGGGYSAGAAYANGPITLGAAYNYFKNPTGTAGSTGLFTDNVNGTSSLSGTLNSAYQSASSYQVAAAGGTYAIGPAVFGLSYSNTKYQSIVTMNGATATFNDVEAGLKWNFTPTFYTGVAYNYTKGDSLTNAAGVRVGNQHYNQLGLVADYALSKRTELYAIGTLQKAAGTSSTGAAAVANIGSLGDSSNDRQAVVRLGIRHKF